MCAFTLQQLADKTGFTLQGDASCVIEGLATIQDASPGQISFLDNKRYRKYLATTGASAIILSPEDASEFNGNALITSNPYLGYAKVAALFDPKPVPKAGIHSSAVLGANCEVADDAFIGPNVVLGDGVHIGAGAIIGAGCVIEERSRIGANSELRANVTVYYDVIIGESCLIHSGAVIGSDGFGMANERGIWHKIPQIGGVHIGNWVEIGANTTIDRGAIEATKIKDGVKIDNQVQIAHNVEIGDHTAIAGCVGISGSAKIGPYCMIGGGAGIAGHLEIAPQTIIAALSGVSKTIKTPGGTYAGMPALPVNDWRKAMIRVAQLDALFEKIKEYEALFEQNTSGE